MFDRILQTFTLFNDSDAFDCSFEIKQIMNSAPNQVKEMCASTGQQSATNTVKAVPSANKLTTLPNRKHNQSSSSSESSMSSPKWPSASSSSSASPIPQQRHPQFDQIRSFSCQNVSFCAEDIVQKPASFSDNSSGECLVLHPPLVPIFKVTPGEQSQALHGSSHHGSAGDIARFAQSSFHAKQAHIARLVRVSGSSDSSNPKDNGRKAFNSCNPNDKTSRKCHFKDVTNTRYPRSNDDQVELNGNHFLYRRAWLGQTSLRSLPSQEHDQAIDKTNIYRSASMTTSSVASKQGANSILADAQPNNDQHRLQNLSNEIIYNRRLPADNVAKDDKCGQRVQLWAQSFESLLEDKEGLKAFAAFLRSEYSGENLYFWSACIRYANTEREKDRITLAKDIHDKHLANSATEPVNVDSAARNITELNLNSGNKEIFVAAQKQVYNLMKFDSFTRFIRSDLYKACLSAEKRKQPLPLSAENLDDRLLTIVPTNNLSKLKKSASNAEDRRRRKSLLPWYRKTTRSKSRERSCSEELTEGSVTRPSLSHDGTQFANLQPSKIPIMKAESLRKPCLNGGRNAESCGSIATPMESLCNMAVSSLCRVQFVDGATTMLQTKASETVGKLIERSLEKRGLHYNTFEVYIKGTRRCVDLLANSVEIAGREVEVEQRIAFKLDLPDRKVISVKSKPNKQLVDVIKPILQKYNYDVDRFIVVQREIRYNIDLMQNITAVDGLRLQIVPIAAPIENPTTDNSNYQNDDILNAKCSTTLPPMQMLISKQAAKVATSRRQKYSGTMSLPSNPGVGFSKNSADLQSFNKPLKPLEEKSINADGKGNIPPSRAKYSIPSNQNIDKDNGNGNNCNPNQPNIDVKMPIIAKLKAGVQLHVPERVAGLPDKVIASAALKSHVTRVLEQFNQTADTNETQKITVPIPQQVHVSKATLNVAGKGPPPLPPKPKIVPTKPSNWGVFLPDNESVSNVAEPEVQSHRVSV